MLRFLLVLLVLAVAIYVAVRLVEKRGLPQNLPKPPKRQPPKMVAPDDDEDFLRDLDRKRLNPEDPDG